MPGIPASVTYATRLPVAAPRRRSSPRPRCSLCACTARSRPAGGHAGVREQRAGAARVLGRDHVGVAQRLDRARRRGRRGCRSAWRRARGRVRRRPRRVGHAAQLDPVAGARAASARTRPPRPRSRTRLRRTTGETRHGAQRARAQHRRRRRRRTRRRSGTACPTVCTWRHGRSTSAPSNAVAAEQPAPPRARGRRRPRPPPARHRRARARPSSASSHVEADLEHVAVDDLVVLALDAQLALLLRLGPRPDLEQLAASRSPRPG